MGCTDRKSCVSQNCQPFFCRFDFSSLNIISCHFLSINPSVSSFNTLANNATKPTVEFFTQLTCADDYTEKLKVCCVSIISLHRSSRHQISKASKCQRPTFRKTLKLFSILLRNFKTFLQNFVK